MEDAEIKLKAECKQRQGRLRYIKPTAPLDPIEKWQQREPKFQLFADTQNVGSRISLKGG